jgi:hypothetical protein
MQAALEQFQELETRAENRFREWEEEKWKRENEIEERRRREDREHEFRMLQMLMQASNQPPLYAPYSSMPTYSCPSQPYSKGDDSVSISSCTHVRTYIIHNITS